MQSLSLTHTLAHSRFPSASPRSYSAGDQAQVFWGAGIRDQAQLKALIDTLIAAGMPTLDVSKMEAAQLHLRWVPGPLWEPRWALVTQK
jgi:hypothetical protein